jgi:hypothetical protein
MALPQPLHYINISLELEGSSNVDLPTLQGELRNACGQSPQWQHLPVVIVPYMNYQYKAGGSITFLRSCA